MKPYLSAALLLTLGWMPGANPAWAEDRELTLALGYLGGGQFQGAELGLDSDLDNTTSLALTLDFQLKPETGVSAVWSHQENGFRLQGLFPATDRFDIDVDYLHIGTFYRPQPKQPGRKRRSFVGISVGLVHLTPGPSGFGSESGFSAAVLGGTTITLNQRWGIRLQGRGWFVFENIEFAGLCGPSACTLSLSGSGMTQLEASAGVTLQF